MANKQSSKYKTDLVHELIVLAQKYGMNNYGVEYIHPDENINSSIIFKDIAYNFHPKSWNAINKTTSCKIRTTKIHPKSVTKGTFEMQSSNSSDALAMNIFCFPDFKKWKGVRDLFRVQRFTSIDFGIKPKVEKQDGENRIGDTTEIDIIFNNSLITECKLTEDGFCEKLKAEVEKYVEFKSVFHTEKLIQRTETYSNYQLIRNILTANQLNGRFILICDMRRPDLAKSFYETVRCIKDIDLRMRCEIIYWQDISRACGAELKLFLKEKYGIC